MKKILSEVFSVGSLLSGIIGISLGFFSYNLLQVVKSGTFEKFFIFIATGMVLILIAFVLGYLMNKTLFKNEE